MDDDGDQVILTQRDRQDEGFFPRPSFSRESNCWGIRSTDGYCTLWSRLYQVPGVPISTTADLGASVTRWSSRCCGGSSQSDEIHPADTVQQTVEESLTWRPASIPQASSRSRLVKQCLNPPAVESLPLLWPREAPVDEMSRVPCSEPALSSIRPGPWCARIWPWLASIASNLRVASGIRHWLAPRLPPPAPPLSNSPAPRTPVRKLILSSLQLTRLVDTLG